MRIRRSVDNIKASQDDVTEELCLLTSNEGLWRIVLKKSFFADNRKFSGPLVRLSRCEVRDHINYRKSDRWPSYRFYRALQRLKSPMRYICEIFGARQFSTFSTWGNSGIEPDKGKGISSPGT